MVETLKTVNLFDATKSADMEFCPDIDNLEEFLVEPFKIPNIIHTQVTIPTMIRFQFLATHVIKAVNFMVQKEMMTEVSAQALKKAIEESGAYEIETTYTYEFKTLVKGCNE